MFDWRNSTTENKALRTHSTKDFSHPTEINKRVVIQSSTILHAYTDKGFEDITTELPDYKFPEGKELNNKQLRHFVMKLPAWGKVELEKSGSVVRVLDRKGISIFKYHSPIVVGKGKAPYKVIDKDGKKIKDTFKRKDDTGSMLGHKVVNSDDAEIALFDVVDSDLYIKPPELKKNSYPIQVYDDTDTDATNNKDALLQLIDPDTNFGSHTSIYVQRSDNEAFVNRMVMGWTLPSVSGTITAIELYLFKFGGNDANGGNSVAVHELTQAFTEAGVTWNKYDGSNAWTAAGGDYSGTVVQATNTPADDNWQSWDIGPGATNPISGLTWGSTIDLLLKYVTEAGGGAYQYESYRSKESEADPANVPYIEITYTLIVAPTVTTQAVTSILATTATGNGNITDDGGNTPSAWGTCLATTANPDTGDTVDAGSGAGAEGAFTTSITGLTAGTKYHVRAYATNTGGTSYGADVTFITPISISAGLTASATVAYLAAWDRAMSPSMTVAASLAYAMAWKRATVSNLTISAIVARSMNRTISTTADMVVSATVVKAVTWVRDTTSNLTTAVSVAKSRAKTITTSANLTVSVTITKALAYARASISNLTASTTIDRNVTYTRDTTSNLAVSTTISRLRDRLITTAPGLTISATVAKAVTWTRNTTSNLTASVSIAKSRARTIATTSNLAVSVTVAKALGFVRVITSNLTVSATVSRVVAFVRDISTNLTISATVLILRARTIATSANLTISATVSRTLAYHQSISAGLTIAVSLVKSRGRTIVTSANLAVSATVDRVATFTRATNTALSISATVSRVLAYNKSITSGLTAAVMIVNTWSGSAANYFISMTANLVVSTSIKRYKRKVGAIFITVKNYTLGKLQNLYTLGKKRDKYTLGSSKKDYHLGG